jgi:hypothetical protein
MCVLYKESSESTLKLKIWLFLKEEEDVFQKKKWKMMSPKQRHKNRHPIMIRPSQFSMMVTCRWNLHWAMPIGGI